MVGTARRCAFAHPTDLVGARARRRAAGARRRAAPHTWRATNRPLIARRFPQTRVPAILRPVAKKNLEKPSDQNRHAWPEEETHEALRLGLHQDAWSFAWPLLWTFRIDHRRGLDAGRRAEEIRYRRHRHRDQDRQHHAV